MFQELMPLLAQRTLLLIVARVGADEIRVNVIPQRAKSTDMNQNDALLTPLSISETAKELDEALSAQLAEFVATHLGLSSTLKSAKEQMDAVGKAVKESARKQVSSKSEQSPSKATPSDVAPSDGSTEASGLSPDSPSYSLLQIPVSRTYMSRGDFRKAESTQVFGPDPRPTNICWGKAQYGLQ